MNIKRCLFTRHLLIWLIFKKKYSKINKSRNIKREKIMLDILIDTIIDSLKLLPFLFLAYLIMEYIEHKISDKSKEKIKKSGKIGPVIRKFIWNIPTMWIFSSSNELLCS